MISKENLIALDDMCEKCSQKCANRVSCKGGKTILKALNDLELYKKAFEIICKEYIEHSDFISLEVVMEEFINQAKEELSNMNEEKKENENG